MFCTKEGFMVVEPAMLGGGMVGLICSAGFWSATRNGISGCRHLRKAKGRRYHQSHPVNTLPFCECRLDMIPVILF